MLNNLFISLNYKEELRFQNQYSEFTNNSPGKETQEQSGRSGRAELAVGAFSPSCSVGQFRP